MSDSSKLAHSLLIDLEYGPEPAVGYTDNGLNDTQAQTVAIASVTLAINELRKAITNIGKAADATAGFTADIAAALVDDYGYDESVVQNVTYNPQVRPFPSFADLRIA